MNKKKEGLIDNNEGDFILNESGTSISNGIVEEEIKKFNDVAPDREAQEDVPETSSTDDV